MVGWSAGWLFGWLVQLVIMGLAVRPVFLLLNAELQHIFKWIFICIL